jgi:hypothetical protein
MSLASAGVEPAKYAADDDQHKGRLKLRVPWINPGWPRGELSEADLTRQRVLPPMLKATKRPMPTKGLVMALKASRSEVEPYRQHSTSGYSEWWCRAKVKFIWGKRRAAACREPASRRPPQNTTRTCTLATSLMRPSPPRATAASTVIHYPNGCVATSRYVSHATLGPASDNSRQARGPR